MDIETEQPVIRETGVEQVRSWLTGVCDLIIPSDERLQMPAASEVDSTGRQLDLVLAARPDLLRALVRAIALTATLPPEDAVRELREAEAGTYEAVCLVVAGCYYTHPAVRELLGYTGQEPKPVRSDQVPEYVEDGLLERVVERGGRFRHV